MCVDTVVNVTKSVVALHNFLMHGKHFDIALLGLLTLKQKMDFDIEGLRNISQIGSHNHTNSAKQIRQDFLDYFCTIGEDPWQYKLVTSTHNHFDRNRRNRRR